MDPHGAREAVKQNDAGPTQASKPAGASRLQPNAPPGLCVARPQKKSRLRRAERASSNLSHFHSLPFFPSQKRSLLSSSLLALSLRTYAHPKSKCERSDHWRAQSDTVPTQKQSYLFISIKVSIRPKTKRRSDKPCLRCQTATTLPSCTTPASAGS